ncbi:MAG: type II secretion system inner membrane protein GspF [Deltaproteobacteria bacterium]|nr:type II secretion system inner membrane protein GspF [Deltaproteobacteria bacterium]
MPVYQYKGLDASGKSIRGMIDADSPRSARMKLRGGGIYPSELQEETHSETSRLQAARNLRTIFQRVRLQDTAVMTRQLATLIGAGVPLVPALNALITQVDNDTLRKVITQVRERVNEGSTLSDAMKSYPRVFSDLYTNMVNAGEASGALEVVLLRLADFIENQVRLRNKIHSTLAYPIFMLFIGSGILLFLLTFVIPSVTQIFQDSNRVLPAPTILLLTISEFLKNYWWLLVGVTIGAVMGCRRYIHTEAGRMFFDRLKLHLPLLGGLTTKIAISRFARTLATLLNSGIPLMTSLGIVRTVVNNGVIADAIGCAQENIREGQEIHTPLAQCNVFPPLVIQMVSIGERSGELEHMLFKVAESYDNEVESSISSLTSMLEPIMILVMGVVVGFIVLAILLPIFEMTQGIM